MSSNLIGGNLGDYYEELMFESDPDLKKGVETIRNLKNQMVSKR